MSVQTANRYKVIIVGGGPAGLATALHLAQIAPDLIQDTLILEAAEHPRPKLCGGGVTFHGEEQLRRLGLEVDVPAFAVNRLLFRFGDHSFTTDHPAAMRVIQRSEFDAALARAVTVRGLALQSNERLSALEEAPDGMVLTTNQGRYHARVVVGADGANSMVRRRLGMRSHVGVARLLRVMTPVDPATSPVWQERTAVFDFSCVLAGVQGYVWDFPCYVDGRAFMNRGIFDSRIVPLPVGAKGRGKLKETFDSSLRTRRVDLDQLPLEGHPVRWFNPAAEFARPHVLLTGDAAGVDALFAEGISYAMEYGILAAEAIQRAFDDADFSFRGYRNRLVKHRLGRLLQRRAWIAQQLYTRRCPPAYEIFWRLAAVSPAWMKQSIGAALGVLPP